MEFGKSSKTRSIPTLASFQFTTLFFVRREAHADLERQFTTLLSEAGKLYLENQ
jgi:hypothetical protein